MHAPQPGGGGTLHVLPTLDLEPVLFWYRTFLTVRERGLTLQKWTLTSLDVA